MFKRLAFSVALASLICGSVASADQRPTYKGPLSASEKQFVSSIQTDLLRRFPTAQDAERAGYFRYTNPDSTGTISYANLQWQSADPQHPSQLWYDKKGQLMGADYSVVKTSDARPHWNGINPGRWYEFDDHVHYVLVDQATGKKKYDLYIMAPQYRAAGGNPKSPTAQELVTMHKAPNATSVAHVFEMPSIWDLIVWVRPNPLGAFSYKNPAVPAK